MRLRSLSLNRHYNTSEEWSSARARETRAMDEGFLPLSPGLSFYRRAARSFHAFASLRREPGLDVAEGGINWRGARSLMISPRSRRAAVVPTPRKPPTLYPLR